MTKTRSTGHAACATSGAVSGAAARCQPDDLGEWHRYRRYPCGPRQHQDGRGQRLAALTLFLLAGLIPETVATYNTPPLVLLARPLDLLFLSAFYGSVALLVREFMRRRAVRWAVSGLAGHEAG
jgi:hypothetical protein